MSLIINMLKDLDQRKHQVTPNAMLIPAHQDNTFEWRDHLSKVIIVFSVVAFLGLGTYLYFHKKSTHELAIPAEMPVVKTVIHENNSDLTHPVTISGVSFETKHESTDVIFLLSTNALYRLVSDEKNHVLNVYIDNATMQSDLPTLIGAAIAIHNITAITTKAGMKFSITMKPEAFLKSVNFNADEKNPELVVAIGNAEPLPDVAPKVASGIKSPAVQTVITEQYQRAVELSSTGNKQEAINSLTKLLSLYPDYDDARVALAAITLESGNASLARKIIDDGLALTPDYLPLIELKARVLTSEGKTKEALMVLQSEQPLITDAPSYHALIAALYSRQNNHNFAAEIYQKLVRINPHEGSWWFGLGVSLDKLGRSQDAIYAYTKAATEGRINTQAMTFLQNRLQILQEPAHA